MFFELVQVALGVRERLSRNPSDGEWSELFDLAQRHQPQSYYRFRLRTKVGEAGYERWRKELFPLK